MEKSFFNRKAFFAVLTIFVFVFAIQMADPASAAKWKKFSTGKKNVYDSYYKTTLKYTWKAYKTNSNHVKVVIKMNGHTMGTRYYTKLSKKRLKIIDKQGTSTFVKYRTTTLNAVNYYKKYFKRSLS